MGSVWKAPYASARTWRSSWWLYFDGYDDASYYRSPAGASIVSPNLVRIYPHGNEKTIAFIAMELCLGETLSARLRRVRKLSPQETVLIARDIAQGISVAHRAGIIHRDLKPDNVFMARGSDGNEIAKVLDFGIAKSVAIPGMQTQQGIVVASPLTQTRAGDRQPPRSTRRTCGRCRRHLRGIAGP